MKQFKYFNTPILLLFFFLSLALISLYLLRNLKLDSSLINTFKQDNLVARNFRAVNDAAEFKNDCFVLLEIKKNQGWIDDHMDLIQEFSNRLSGLKTIQNVNLKQDLLTKLLQHPINSRALLYLSKEEFDEFTQLLSKEKIEQNLKKLEKNSILQSLTYVRSYFDPKSALREKDPLGVVAFLKKKIFDKLNGAIFFKNTKYLFDNNRQNLIIRFIPRGSALDTGFIKNLVQETDSLRKKFEGEYFKKNHKELPFFISLTGPHFINNSNYKALTRELTLIGLLTTALVIFLIAFFTSKPVFPFITTITLFFTLSLTFGVLAIFPVKWSLFAFFFVPVIIGLSDDYSIHTILQFREYLQQNPAVSLSQVLNRLTMKNLTYFLLCSLSTISVFLTFILSEFNSTFQIGIAASIGLFLSILVTSLILPVVLYIFKGWSMQLTINRLNWLNLIQGALKNKLQKFKLVLLISFIVLLTAGFVLSSQLRFSNSFGSLSSKTNRPDAVFSKVKQIFGITSKYLVFKLPQPLIPSSLTNSQLLLIKKFSGILEELKTHKLITNYLFIGPWLPDPGETELLLKKIEATPNFNVENFKNVFNDALPSGLKNNDYLKRRYPAFIERLLKNRNKILVRDFQEDSILNEIWNKYVKKDGLFAYIYLDNSRDEETVLNDLELFLYQKLDNTPYLITGFPILKREFRHLLRKDFKLIIFCMLIVVTFLAYAYFKRFKYAILTIAPAFLGVTISLLIYSWLKFEITFLNFLFIPITLGVGFDCGFLMVKEGRENLSLCNQNIFLSTLTTIVSFLTLAFTSFSDIQIMGVFTAMGITISALASLFLVPVWMFTD